MLKLTNTLTRTQEPFSPLDGQTVRMYVCGPTVHDFAHIGNLRYFVWADILRRHLKSKGWEMHEVMNITDVDDNIIEKALAAGVDIKTYTEKYGKCFLEDIDTLGIERPELLVHATEHIPEMVDLVQTLLDKGYAYREGDSVYFRISQFEAYGRLAGLDRKNLLAGARVDVDKYDKEAPQDFVLWKAPKDEREPRWETDIGTGRPGWHLECSAMSAKYLGDDIDIHCGGVDLVFPHHENEIAQSESASGAIPFSKIWMHNGLLRTSGATMSKSLGNAFNVNAALEEYSSDAIRLWILQSHYRTNPLLDKKLIATAERSMRRIRQTVDIEPNDSEHSVDFRSYDRRFIEAMDDDLNTPKALAAVFDLCREINRGRDNKMDVSGAVEMVRRLTGVLGLRLEVPPKKAGLNDQEIEALVQARKDARDDKRWDEADTLRDQLAAAGISISDTGEDTVWSRD